MRSASSSFGAGAGSRATLRQSGQDTWSDRRVGAARRVVRQFADAFRVEGVAAPEDLGPVVDLPEADGALGRRRRRHGCRRFLGAERRAVPAARRAPPVARRVAAARLARPAPRVRPARARRRRCSRRRPARARPWPRRRPPPCRRGRPPGRCRGRTGAARRSPQTS